MNPKTKSRMGILLIMVFLFANACQDDCHLKNPEMLYGRWKVFHINRGGEVIGGPGFNGTEFTFTEQGKVKSETPKGDTASVNYVRNCDTLVYTYPEGEERYRIDSLGQERLRLSGDLQGIPTVINLLRVPDIGETRGK